MYFKNDIKIKMIYVPKDYTLDVLNFDDAFDRIKVCKYCGTDNDLRIHYEGSHIYTGYDTIFEKIQRRIFNRIKHKLKCTCNKCGASSEIYFYTSRRCQSLYPRFQYKIMEANGKTPIPISDEYFSPDNYDGFIKKADTLHELEAKYE